MSTVKTPNSECKQDAQTFELPDGRLLGYTEYGDLSGNPLLYFHGLPSSRLECAEFDPIAKEQNIRLIGVDRPGAGLSTFQPDRKILDWPDDVLRLADHLTLAQFRVMGSSGGSPYALACAHALPHSRLQGVGILAGSGPWEASNKNLPLIGRITWQIWRVAPWTINSIFMRPWIQAAQNPDPKALETLWDQAVRWMSEKDRKVNEDATTRNFIVAGFRAAFAQGGQGPTHEVKLLTQPWGFNLEDVQNPCTVKLWYGDEDTNTPLDHARHLAERLPRTKLTVYPGDTHFTIAAPERMTEIFRDIMTTDVD